METKIFDPDTFNQWKDIDPESWKSIVQEIIDAFLSVVEAQHGNLQKGFQEKNFEAIRVSAHAMKSSLANVGCIAGSKVLKKIEDFSADQNWEELQVCEKQLRSLYPDSIRQIKEYRKKN